MDMASWIARVRVELIHIVRCHQRPIPLHHEIFRCGLPEFQGVKRSFFKVLQPNGKFLKWNLQQAIFQRSQLENDRAAWRCPPYLCGLLIGRRGQNLRQLQEGLSATARIVDNEIQVQSPDA